MGYRMVLFPLTAFRAAMKAAEDTLRDLFQNGTQKASVPKMQTRAELYDLLEYGGEALRLGRFQLGEHRLDQLLVLVGPLGLDLVPHHGRLHPCSTSPRVGPLAPTLGPLTFARIQVPIPGNGASSVGTPRHSRNIACQAANGWAGRERMLFGMRLPVATVLLNDSEHHRQTQAGAARTFGGEEGLEYTFLDLGAQATPESVTALMPRPSSGHNA